MRKPQRGTRPRPSAHPWAFFTKCGDWGRQKVTNLCLYASVLAIQHWAEMWQTEAGITPQTCTASREPRYSSITTIGTTFHIQYRSIQTKVSNVSHTTTQELLKKARGVCRGAVALRPLCGFHFFPKLNHRLINKFLFFVSFWTYLFNNCKKFNNFLVVFTIKKVYHIKINYKQ